MATLIIRYCSWAESINKHVTLRGPEVTWQDRLVDAGGHGHLILPPVTSVEIGGAKIAGTTPRTQLNGFVTTFWLFYKATLWLHGY